MKSKNIIGKIVWKKSDIVIENGRSRLAGKLVLAFCILCVLLSAYVLGKLYLTNSEVQENSAVIDPGIHFQDCKILREDCPDGVVCNLFSFCGEGSYKICKIYDCGDTYGVFTQDFNGKIETERKEKNDKITVAAKKDACGQTMKIVEQKCDDGKMQVMVKLAPTGECKIGNFVLLYEGSGSQPNKFRELKGNNYFITADACGKINSIIPQTEEGIPIF